MMLVLNSKDFIHYVMDDMTLGNLKDTLVGTTSYSNPNSTATVILMYRADVTWNAHPGLVAITNDHGGDVRSWCTCSDEGCVALRAAAESESWTCYTVRAF